MRSNVDIYVISASGGTPRQVTTSPAIDAVASWSIDGRFIYFGSNRDGQVQVWKVPSSGEEPGNARQVTRGGGFAAIESTDGRHVYFTKRTSGRGSAERPLEDPGRGRGRGGRRRGVRAPRPELGPDGRRPLLRRRGALLLGNELGRPLPGFRSAPRDRGSPTPARSLPRRTCHQHLAGRPLDALHPEPGRIRSNAGGDLSLMQATF